MAYSEKVLEHYENPRNVGSFPKDEKDVGTGVVGAPECGDVMKLQIKVETIFQCTSCKKPYVFPEGKAVDPRNSVRWLGAEYFVPLKDEERCCANPKIAPINTIVDAKFKTFGCGSAIASSSYVTELVKGKTLDEAVQIKNSQIVEELALPPVKIHCSVLAEDAIKAAIADWKKRKGDN